MAEKINGQSLRFVDGCLLIFEKAAGAGFFVLRWLLLRHDAGDGVAVAAAVDGEVFFVDGDELGLRILLREGDKGGVGKVHAVVFAQFFRYR